MRFPFLLIGGVLLATVAAHAAGTTGPGVPNFSVHDGYTVTLAGTDLGETRFIEPGAPGILYLSQPNSKSISTLKKQGDGTYKKIGDFTTDKESVHGMNYKDGWLWFTQSQAVWKGRDTDGDGKADEEVQIVGGLEGQGGHWWRSILVTDDGFFTSVGDSGNINDLTDSDREKIWKYSLDGKTRKLWSSGIRNTEKLRFRPGTQELYGCDHGSDWYGKLLGDTDGNQPITNRVPDDEFNNYVEGGFYRASVYREQRFAAPGIQRPARHCGVGSQNDFAGMAGRTALGDQRLDFHYDRPSRRQRRRAHRLSRQLERDQQTGLSHRARDVRFANRRADGRAIHRLDARRAKRFGASG